MSVETTHMVKWVLCESEWISQEISSGVHGMVVQTDIATGGDRKKAFCIWKDYLYIPTLPLKREVRGQRQKSLSSVNRGSW